MKQMAEKIDQRIIDTLQRHRLMLARFSIFTIYIWFGLLKLIGESPASPIAESLINNTVGMQNFNSLFIALGIMEVTIGILFLIPKAIRVVIPLLLIHLAIVSSPLLLVPNGVWDGFLIPTLEGQYIIKNLLVVALAVTVASYTKPVRKTKNRS